jgi:WD40 repeat protein
MAFTPDGRALAVATPGEPHEFELADGKSRRNGLVSDGVDFLDVASGRRERRFEIPMNSASAIAFSADGRTMAVAGGWHAGQIVLCRTDDGREIDTLAAPAAVTRPNALAFAPDGRSLAAGLDDTTVLIWELKDAR